MPSKMKRKQMFSWLLLVQTLIKCLRANPNTKIFTTSSQLLQRHYEPAPVVIAERHKIWTASKGGSESATEFVAS